MTMSELPSSNNSSRRDFSIDSIIGKNSNRGGTKSHRTDETEKRSELPPKSAFGSVSPNGAPLHPEKNRLPISVSPKTMAAVSRGNIRVPEAIHSQTPAPHANPIHYNMDPRLFMSGRQPLVHPLQQLMLNQEMMNTNGNIQPMPWNYERLAGLYHPGLTVPPNPAFLFHPYRKPKRVRTAFTPNQLLQLEKSFEKNHYVVGQERKDLALELKLSETQVKVWFQNRRTKYKRTKSEDDPSGCNGETAMYAEENFKDDEDISVDSEDESEFDENDLNVQHDYSASER